MILIILLIVCCELFAAASQIFYKKVVDQNSLDHSLVHVRDYVRFAIGIFRHPLAWAGLGMMVLSTILWLMALSQGDLSLVFPLGSIQYILVLAGSKFFLSEKVDLMRLLGTALIAIGIVVISVT